MPEAPAPDDPRPAFSREYPRTPALDALVRAFALGDYARVRREAPRLAQSDASEAERAAARELVDRTRADRLAIALLGGAALLLATLSAYWIAHAHTPPP